jgi:3-deoxy-D-manno-octulosonate 8-phosphate phosphatase KdsC-like HAD superfamily phosphatase
MKACQLCVAHCNASIEAKALATLALESVGGSTVIHEFTESIISRNMFSES